MRLLFITVIARPLFPNGRVFGDGEPPPSDWRTNFDVRHQGNHHYILEASVQSTIQ